MRKFLVRNEAKYVGFLQGLERKLEKQWCYYLYLMLDMCLNHIFFCFAGDRTKHLKNIHGVLKTTASATSVSDSNSSSGHLQGHAGNGNTNPFIVEDTSSSISSFQSTSDQSSVAGSLVESPTKTEPMETFSIRDHTMGTIMSSPNLDEHDSGVSGGTETITMTLEDISQFAQDIY